MSVGEVKIVRAKGHPLKVRRIELDGQEIHKHVRSWRVEQEFGQAPRVWLELIATTEIVEEEEADEHLAHRP